MNLEEFISKHPGSFFTILYGILIIMGLLYESHLFRLFGLQYYHFVSLKDIIIMGIRDPNQLFIAILFMITLLNMAMTSAIIGYKPHSAFLKEASVIIATSILILIAFVILSSVVQYTPRLIWEYIKYILVYIAVVTSLQIYLMHGWIKRESRSEFKLEERLLRMSTTERTSIAGLLIVVFFLPLVGANVTHNKIKSSDEGYLFDYNKYQLVEAEVIAITSNYTVLYILGTQNVEVFPNNEINKMIVPKSVKPKGKKKRIKKGDKIKPG